MRILKRDDIFPRKCVPAYEVDPRLRLYVQPLDCIIREYIARVLDGHDMRIISQNLVGDGIDIIPLLILCKVQVDQGVHTQLLPCYRICPILEQPCKDVVDVEDGAIWSADGSGKRLEGNGAEVEGKTLEGGIRSGNVGYIGASTGGISGIGGPFAVGDLGS